MTYHTSSGKNTLLVVTDYWDQVNGVATELKNTIKQLDARGFKVHVISTSNHSDIAKWCNWARIIYISTPEGKIGFKYLRHCIFKKLPFTTGFRTNWPEALNIKYKIPLSWSFMLFKWLHRYSKAVLVPTRSGRDQLRKYGVENVKLWSCGVDQSMFSPELRNELTTVGKPILLCVARAVKEKNIDDFCTMDTSKFGNRVTKIHCGDGPYLAELKQKYPDVIFTGTQTKRQLAVWYASADVLVFPSRSDTFGIVMIESMNCGTPVAAYPVTGPIDVIEPGITGCTKDNLTDAVEIALNYNRDLCATQAQKWTWEHCTQEFIDTLYYR